MLAISHEQRFLARWDLAPLEVLITPERSENKWYYVLAKGGGQGR